MYNEPLGLPAGSIRAILILILTIFIAFATIFNIIIPEAVSLIWIGGLGYYLGYKQVN